MINKKQKVRKYDVDETYFEKIDNPTKAYFFGLMFADGIVGEIRSSSNGKISNSTSKYISLCLKTEDGYIVERLAQELKAEIPLRIEKPGRLIKGTQFKGSGNVRLTIGSVRLFNSLNEKGCTPKKSLTLKFPTCVPDTLMSHFIRGYFDGDGGITKCAGGWYKIMILGTEQFLISIGDILKKQLGLEICLYKKGNIYNFYLFKKEAVIKFCDWIYEDSDIHIIRKYDRYINYKAIPHWYKKVLQMDMSEKPIKEWKDATEAAKALNWDSRYIGQCCNGRSKSSMGYKWRYITKEKE